MSLSHRRTHNLLLISRLLSQPSPSPFTLILDTLEQSSQPLIKEYLRRSHASRTNVIYLSFESSSSRKEEGNGQGIEKGISKFITCYDKSAGQIRDAVLAALSTTTGTGTSSKGARRNLIIIDTLHPLCMLSLDAKSSLNLTAYLSSFLTPSSPSTPQSHTSLVAVYHSDLPLPQPPPSLSYQPSPLSLLSYLATTIFKLHSLAISLAAKEARERSQVAPSFGLSEEREGILIGLKPARTSKGVVLKPDEKGIILELEHRRKSGRGVREWYFLPTVRPSLRQSQSQPQQNFKEIVTLLDDHPLFRRVKEDDTMSEQELAGMTFELGLTDRQKLERDGVVLPYFDAQKGGGLTGPGEGGRILYDMGSEDDFDEEEDEI